MGSEKQQRQLAQAIAPYTIEAESVLFSFPLQSGGGGGGGVQDGCMCLHSRPREHSPIPPGREHEVGTSASF